MCCLLGSCVCRFATISSKCVFVRIYLRVYLFSYWQPHLLFAFSFTRPLVADVSPDVAFVRLLASCARYLMIPASFLLVLAIGVRV